MIEIKHLNLIKEIAVTGNMTKAAEKLFLTQPSLSHQLKEIESKLNAQLFLRVNKRMVLTKSGEKLLAAADEVLPVLKRTEGEIKLLSNGHRVLKISTHCYTNYQWLPSIMKKFQNKFPNTKIEIATEAMDDSISFLMNGKIDVTIINQKTKDRGVAFEKVFDDELILLVPKDHPLSKKKFVEARDFKNENLITYNRSFDNNGFAQEFLIPENIAPASIIKMQITEARVELVRAGMGITVLSRWLVKSFLPGNPSIVQVRIGPRGLYRSWYAGVLNQKLKDSHISHFIKFLKEQELGSGIVR